MADVIKSGSIALDAVCITVNVTHDNVAVFYKDVKYGTSIILPDNSEIVLQIDINKGQRIALKDIVIDDDIVQYGSSFGLSKGVKKGDIITRETIEDIDSDIDVIVEPEPPLMPFSSKQYDDISFQGYKRTDGRIGTRNYFIVIPTSLCASETALQIARKATNKYLKSFKNIDGIIAIHTTEGCGCATNVQIERFLGILSQYMKHPNVGGALVVDLGCEQTNYGAVNAYLNKESTEGRSEPIDWLTIQEQGGVNKTAQKALSIIESHLSGVNAIDRQPYHISNLVVGTECGASDAFSGITANPLIGGVVDRIVSAGGSAILTEVPEMFGAEHILMKRMRSKKIIEKFRKIINWYKDLARRLDVNMAHNLVPENIAGGLINACIKSLGAITKGGVGPIEDVLEYGEPLKKTGLNIMQGPGNDMESVTGMVASGANIICFSTGKGTVTGAALVPVIKVASNSALYTRMTEDMDFNAGDLIDSEKSINSEILADQLFSKVISAASGEQSKSEINGQRQFQVWTAGKLSL
ncbi:MAG: hypothetical protein HOK52_00895 [Candidatus Marinimicrobia bacterium]|jgi:altronate hydrolase|nr:hypothetical protein [Candidatus Neomarinimicrobiota bacterium]